jgi:hypothetical protein
VDERRNCQDIGSACVTRLGVVHTVSTKPQGSDLGAVLAPQERQSYPAAPSLQHAVNADGWYQPKRARAQRRPPSLEISNRASHHAVGYFAPDSRTFSQPSISLMAASGAQ